MKGPFKIYALVDPRNPAIVKYVGATGHTLKWRLSSHCGFNKTKKSSSNKREQWLIDLFNAGVRPMIKLLERCHELEVELREQFWISKYEKSGELLNDLKRASAYTMTAQFEDRLTREQVLTELQLRKVREFQESRWPGTFPKIESSNNPLSHTESLKRNRAEVERRMAQAKQT